MTRFRDYLRTVYTMLFVTLAAPAMALAQATGASPNGSAGNAGVGGSGTDGVPTSTGWGWWMIALAILIGLIVVAWLVSLARTRKPPSPV